MVVVLGATGKIGRATIRELRRRRLPVRAVVRNPASADDLAALGCEIAVADLRDASAVRAAVDGAEAVQVICPVSTRAPDAEADMNGIIETIASSLEVAQPQAILAISDYGAELAAGTGITLTFHRLEARLKRIPAALTFLRSAEHMQNWTRFTASAADTGLLPSLHSPVTKLFPTVSAVDVGVLAAELLLTSDGYESPRIVHAEGPRRYTPRDVAAILSGLIGREIVARELPRSDWVPALVRGGVGRSYAGLVADLYDAHNAGRIDAEQGAGEIRRCPTGLEEVFASLGLMAPRASSPPTP